MYVKFKRTDDCWHIAGLSKRLIFQMNVGGKRFEHGQQGIGMAVKTAVLFQFTLTRYRYSSVRQLNGL